ncbi:extracellular solute-binding protein [Thalassospira aquimaris]|uniref:Extracellular solute-binding protein n=1 Tax=Thalassospira aquimaris TaxID=3037796 RepID=A0ABT6GI28_9PROT|nr:extracellular solute-binding protein [Thalassospira sp. FZY0004]MDG4721472.1 extracellular solute-binding protein [Thalassospira sp. FZY0004]
MNAHVANPKPSRTQFVRKTVSSALLAFGVMAGVAGMTSAAVRAQDADKPVINPAPTVKVEEAELAPLTTTSHGISLYGDLKYGPDFAHFDYVNPDAPKGGTLIQSSIVAFDTLNPFTLKGTSAAGLGLIYDSLMASSADEPYAMYGLIARSIEVPDDRSFAIFHLDPRARFQDGSEITAEDVVFSYEVLVEKGSPVYRQYFSQIEGAEAIDDLTVKFTFKPGNNRETPMTAAGISIMPKKFWDGKDFSKTTFELPVGSGAYKVASIEAGRRITYERVKDYWAADLPVNRGQNNFDVIRYDTYLDPEVQRQAFLAGEYMVRSEHSSRDWSTAYDTPAVERGDIQKKFMPDDLPVGMQAYVMNNRLPIFADWRVRKALQYGFDFQWLSRAMFYGAYKRTDSYFVNSELASSGIPTGDELALLEPYRDQLPAELFTQPFKLPDFDETDGRRKALRESMTLLNEAGWELRDKVLVNKETGEPFRFELIIRQPGLEKIALVLKARLKQLGVQLDIRLIDTGQWVNRIQAFDFDVTTFWWTQALTPGNEQRVFWSSEAADQPGSRNFAGIKSPVVDAMVEKVASANSWHELVTATHALDRVLLWGYYVIPQYYLGGERLAWWNIFGQPDTIPLKGESVMRWWIDPEKAAKLPMGGN